MIKLSDVCLRVEVIRESAVGIMAPILIDPTLLEMTSVNKTVPDALKAIAWVVGEYAHYLTDHGELMHALTQQQVTQLPGQFKAYTFTARLKSTRVQSARICRPREVRTRLFWFRNRGSRGYSRHYWWQTFDSFHGFPESRSARTKLPAENYSRCRSRRRR